jgi:hypothetical protein
MLHDKGKLTLPHLQLDARRIKNSADAMHNGRANTKIQQLPPHLLGGTWHPIYNELPCAGQNSYQRTSRYGLPPCTMQEPSCLQLQRGKDFVQQQRRSMRQGQRKRRWCKSSWMDGWQKGAHGYILEVKADNIIRLGCENVHCLSIFHPAKSKMHKLTHLHQRHQTDGACIVY